MVVPVMHRTKGLDREFSGTCEFHILAVFIMNRIPKG
jgi:hypothetical protein